jgi:hypothetical protein
LEKSDLAEFIAKHLFERRPFYFRAHTRLRDQDITLDQFINLVQQNLNQK